MFSISTHSTEGAFCDPQGGKALAYLVSRYPAVSHTFIYREVQQLRELGLPVEVASINKPDRTGDQMPADECEESSVTYGVKQHGWRGALQALTWAAKSHPRALLRTLRAGWSFGRGRRHLYAMAYAVEALMVARWMDRRQLRHLHVHFGNEAATVGVLVKTFNGAGLSLTIHGPDEFDDVPGQQLRRKVAAADLVVCISQFARSQIMRLSDPEHWDKLQMCHLGVDPEQFKPASGVRSSGPVRLLSVGRLTPAKGQMLLLQACAALKREGLSFRLTIVGDGPDRARLEEVARREELYGFVTFTGALNQDEVRDQFLRADGFVLPSLAEGIPVVLMESMASGVPVLTTPVNGIPELVQHSVNGLLATPGCVESLTKQLRRLIEDAALRERVALVGRRTVERDFNLRTNVAALADIFSTLPALADQGAR